MPKSVVRGAAPRRPRGWHQGSCRGLLSLWVLAVVVLTGCAAPQRYVWAQALPPLPAAAPGSYLIDVGDLLDVRVFNEDRLSGRTRVRADGYITLPLLGDIGARGKTPVVLSMELQNRLQRFLKEPTVTISIEETHPINLSVLGEVVRPGTYQLPQRAGVLEALAVAGGLTEDADKSSIFVIRKQPVARIRFTYDLLTSADSGGVAAFPLQSGDVVTAE